jgi:hypothetical protein
MRGLQTGPETLGDPFEIQRPKPLRVAAAVLAGLVFAGLSGAAIQDGPDGVDPLGLRGVAVTEDPAPVTTAMPFGVDYIVIDLRPTAFSFNPQFINPEVPRAIVPKGFGLRIIVPDPVEPESECSAAQSRKCAIACGKSGTTLVSCDVQFEWQPDGTATRTLYCTCAAGGATPKNIAGSFARTVKLRFVE